MKITTLICPACGTVVAENVLEEQRIMKCPYYDCEEILSFEDLQEQTDRPATSQMKSDNTPVN
jgi:hypothetical protein